MLDLCDIFPVSQGSGVVQVKQLIEELFSTAVEDYWMSVHPVNVGAATSYCDQSRPILVSAWRSHNIPALGQVGMEFTTDVGTSTCIPICAIDTSLHNLHRFKSTFTLTKGLNMIPLLLDLD